jgi:hypothetical protein
MSEITAIQELGASIDADLRGPAPELRHSVTRQFASEPSGTRRARSAWRRPVLRAALAGGLAVVLTAGLFVATTVRLWGGSAAASAQAAVLLRHAAAAAAREPALVPRPDQFVYVRAVETAAQISSTDGGRTFRATTVTDVREIWQSADGTRNGLLKELPTAGSWQVTALPGCRNGVPAVVPGSVSPGGACVPDPGYRAGLPVTTPVMRAYLYAHSSGQNPPDVQAFITAGDLIRESYVQPAALAALFRAVAEIPGVTVTRDAVNAAGERGIGVQQTFRGISEQLIFNPKTYAFIGEREVVVGSGTGLPIGTVMDSTAVLDLALVGVAGQQPRA